MNSRDALAVFDAHDVQYAHRLPKYEVEVIVRSAGYFLLDDAMAKVLDTVPGDAVSRDDFKALIEKVAIQYPPKKAEDVHHALQSFDMREAGELTRADLNQILCNMNHKIAFADVDLLFSDLAAPESGKLKIGDIKEHLLRPSKDIPVSSADAASVMPRK